MAASTDTDRSRSDPPGHRGIPAGIVILVVVTSLLAGLLLNAPDILRTAERQAPGWQRTIGVGLMEPIAGVSQFLRLDRPRHTLDRITGRAAPPTTVPAPLPDGDRETATTTTTTTPVVDQRRPVSVDEPLVMFIGGDSMVGQFGPMLENRARRSGVVEAEVEFEFSSGLSRPDFLDWPARLQAVGSELSPDVFVLYFGGNDAQSLYMPDGSWVDYGTAEWEAEYRRRVSSVMDALSEGGYWVYWMGLPIVRSESFRERVALMNSIYQAEAARYERVTFVEAWSLFEGPDGGYREYLPDASGNLVDMRLDDGIHYTTAGAIRLAEATFEIIASDWGLEGD